MTLTRAGICAGAPDTNRHPDSPTFMGCSLHCACTLLFLVR